MNKCKLCLAEEADKTNSHIIPKFLSKRLFENVSPRHTRILDKSGLQKTSQDTPKEDHILCTNCEKKLEILETFFSRRINELNEFEKHTNKYTLGSLGTQEFLICNNYKPAQFVLFIYSIIWRVSISKNIVFENYKLDRSVEEKIRSFLNLSLANSHKVFINNDILIPKELHYTINIMKAKEKNEETRGIMIAYQPADSVFLLFITEFIIFLYLDRLKTEIAQNTFSIIDKQKIIIPLAQTKDWTNLIETIVYKNFKI